MHLAVSDGLYSRLREHLFSGVTEEAAFLIAEPTDPGTLTVTDWLALEPEDFAVRSAEQIELRDDVRPRVIKWAWDRDSSLIEVHSHRLLGGAGFSAVDLHGLAEFVPHVRWRLGNRPYVALVFAPDGFDALAWADDSGVPEPLDYLCVGNAQLRPSGWSMRYLAKGD